MKVCIIDNYDSFTYNLYQYIGEILTAAQYRGTVDTFDIIVKRNDQVTIEELRAISPDCIIISPGPGSPEDENYFGICTQIIHELGVVDGVPLLGVCLGMQGIVHAFGGRVVKAHVPMHGKISPIIHNEMGIFKSIPQQLEIMRYHSLMADPESFPAELQLVSVVGDDLPVAEFDNLSRIREGGSFEIMAIQHKEKDIYGIQFHPESFATEGGKEVIENFLFVKS